MYGGCHSSSLRQVLRLVSITSQRNVNSCSPRKKAYPAVRLAERSRAGVVRETNVAAMAPRGDGGRARPFKKHSNLMLHLRSLCGRKAPDKILC